MKTVEIDEKKTSDEMKLTEDPTVVVDPTKKNVNFVCLKIYNQINIHHLNHLNIYIYPIYL